MICNYCFSNKQISNLIQTTGNAAALNYQCPHCQEINSDDLIEPMFVLEKSILAEKLKQVIHNCYAHECVHGLFGSATMFAREEGDEPNDFAGCLDLEEVCWDLFDDGERLAELISSNINIRGIQQGEDDYFSDKYSLDWKDRCWWDNEEYGLSQWQLFCENVKHKARYFPHPSFNTTEVLQKFSQLFQKLTCNQNLEIYRARKIMSLAKKIAIESNPSCELGKVSIQNAKNNRFSPIGISYGYFALDEVTALKETRITTENYAVGKFSITNDLNLIDFRQATMKAKVDIFNDSLDESLYCQQKFILEFLQDVSKPISDDDQLLEYVPTQIMAEYIWHLGYDGFLFDSSQNENGVNLVIFEAKYQFVSFDIREFG